MFLYIPVVGSIVVASNSTISSNADLGGLLSRAKHMYDTQWRIA